MVVYHKLLMQKPLSEIIVGEKIKESLCGGVVWLEISVIAGGLAVKSLFLIHLQSVVTDERIGQ